MLTDTSVLQRLILNVERTLTERHGVTAPLERKLLKTKEEGKKKKKMLVNIFPFSLVFKSFLSYGAVTP